jgi:hypothetical protein
MRMSPGFSMVCCAAVVVFSSGCLFTRHTTTVVRKNEKPRAVTFESPQAKNIFDGKLVEARTNLNANFSNPRVVAVPFLLWYSSSEVVSDNGIRNDQLAICDANGDNVIALDEATIYAARIDEQVAKQKAERAKIEAEMAGAPPNSSGPGAPANYSTPAAYPAQPASIQQPLEARSPQAPLPPGNYR